MFHLIESRINRSAAIATLDSVAPLVETEQGLAFDDATFGDLVSFAAEIPW